MAKSSRSKTKTSGNRLAKLLQTRRSKFIAIAVGFGVVGAGLALYSSAQSKYFYPTTPVTRQAMAAFMYRAAGSPAPDKSSKCGTKDSQGPFSDVKSSHEFCKEIEWMVKKGIATGYADNTFRPTAGVKREAIAAFLYRLDGKPAITGTKQANPCVSFKDVSSTNQFCKEIYYASKKGYLKGFDDGTFRPTQNATRQAVAAMLYSRAGKPALKTKSVIFADVKANHDFFNAIQWMGEKYYSEGFNKPKPVVDDNVSTTNGEPEQEEAEVTEKPSATASAISKDKLYKTYLCKGSGSSTSTVVKNLQTRLRRMGFTSVSVTGSYGATTAEAVSLWRTLHGSPSGKPGCFYSKTMLAMFRADEERDWEVPAIAKDKLYKTYLCKGDGSSTSTVVKNLQTRLRDMGFTNVPVTGTYGEKTAEAVRFWRILRGRPAAKPGCFYSKTMLSKFRADEGNWKFPGAALAAFFDAITDAATQATDPLPPVQDNRPGDTGGSTEPLIEPAGGTGDGSTGSVMLWLLANAGEKFNCVGVYRGGGTKDYGQQTKFNCKLAIYDNPPPPRLIWGGVHIYDTIGTSTTTTTTTTTESEPAAVTHKWCEVHAVKNGVDSSTEFAGPEISNGLFPTSEEMAGKLPEPRMHVAPSVTRTTCQNYRTNPAFTHITLIRWGVEPL